MYDSLHGPSGTKGPVFKFHDCDIMNFVKELLMHEHVVFAKVGSTALTSGWYGYSSVTKTHTTVQ